VRCLLILEDLDTLLTDENRSFFLNEMDGFASNDGIVIIASCNFPEKLDAAIMERPSRFDRKYHFELPGNSERSEYLSIFMKRFDAEVQLDESGLEIIAGQTNGYSFAYLKELYVSAVVRWVSTEQHRPIVDVMSEQAESLRAQMATDSSESPAPTARRGPQYPYHPAFAGHDDED
jgi:ATP-dependent 26S proteasome regulatory subunit